MKDLILTLLLAASVCAIIGYLTAKYTVCPVEDTIGAKDDAAFYMEGPFKHDDGKWYWKDYTGRWRGPYDSEVIAKKAHNDYLQLTEPVHPETAESTRI